MRLKTWTAAAVIALGLLGVAAPAFATVSGDPIPHCPPITHLHNTADFHTDKDGTPTSGTVFGITPDGGVAIGTPDNPAKVWAKWPTTAADNAELFNVAGSYKTYRYPQASDPSSVVLPTYQLEVMLNGTTGYTTLVYEPYQDKGNAAVHTGEWQSWTVNGDSKVWSTHVLTAIPGDAGQATPEKLVDIVEAYPDARVISWGVNQGTYNAGGLTAVDAVEFNNLIRVDDDHTTGRCVRYDWTQPPTPVDTPSATPTATPPSTPPATPTGTPSGAPSSPVSHPSGTPVASDTPGPSDTLGDTLTGSLPVTGTSDAVKWIIAGGIVLVLFGGAFLALGVTRSRADRT